MSDLIPYAPSPEEDPRAVAARRDLFWQNVVREILSSLSVAAGSGGRLEPTASGAAYSPGPVAELFDGRMAIMTKGGERIPIADIYPVFACSVPSSDASRRLSGDVQCTIFQVRTPSGEMFTLPVSEVRAVHSLSEDLVRRLEQQAAEAAAAHDIAESDKPPFGFAAFTSLTRDQARGSEGPSAADPNTPRS